MDILISFVPWFLYWIFLSCGLLHVAAFAGVIGTVVFNLKDFMAHKGKILPIGSLIFFLVLSILAFFLPPRLLWTWVPLAGNYTLALITLVSILIGKPFTMQYARESVPKEFWGTKPFIHANYVITWVWFFAFIVMSSPDIFDLAAIHSPSWFKWVFSLACGCGAIKFTIWYRKKSHQKSQAPPETPASTGT